MKDNYTTFSSEPIKPLTINDLKKAASKIVVGSTGTGKKKGMFERLMNRLGWYRSSEWYILNPQKFNLWSSVLKNPPEIKNKENLT
jgi:hypothetical protein